MNWKAKTITIAATTLCTACAVAVMPAWSAVKQGQAKQTQKAKQAKQVPKPKQTPSAVKQAAQVQILRATVDRSLLDGKPTNTVTVIGKSGIGIKGANVVMENADDPNFTVHVTTDKFPQKENEYLVVKVKDKIFIPYAQGGDDNTVWSLELKDVDRASAELLHGGVLQEAPKDSITVEFRPWQESYSVHRAVNIGVISTNVGKTPLGYYYGTTAAQNGPSRDTQLSFTATLDGVEVPANPDPLPDGYIGHYHVLLPKSFLSEGVDLTEWLQFDKPGTYQVNAVYTIEITNPTKGAMPSRWKVSYHKQFSIKIVE